MTSEPNEAAVKVISRLGVDTGQGIKSLKDLAQEFASVNKAATETAKTLKQMGSATLPQTAGAAEGAVKKHVHGMVKSFDDLKKAAQQSIPGIEAQIASLEDKLKRAGLKHVSLLEQARTLRGNVGFAKDLQGQLTPRDISLIDDLKAKVKVLQAETKTALADDALNQRKAQKQAQETRRQEADARKQAAADKRRLAQEDKEDLKARETIARETARIKKQQQQEEAKQRREAERAERQRMQQLARDDNTRTKEQIKQWKTVEAQKAAVLRTQERDTARTLLQETRTAAKEQGVAAAKGLHAAGTLPTVQAEIVGLQSRIKLEGISSNQLRARAALLRYEADQLAKQTAGRQHLTREETASVQSLQRRASALRAEINIASADQRSSMFGGMSNMLGRRMQWFGAGLLFYGAQSTIRNVLADVGDVETRMTQLGRVMEDPLYKMESMRREIFKLGEEFGFTFQPVQDIALRWAQAGYDVRESLELTRGSLLALNTAELDNEQSTTGLIGIMKQWQMAASELVPTIDKINKVADDYSVTSQDLVDGLLRSSGAAKNANMTMEQTIGLITAMKEASGRSGKEVGNALNSIISYMSKGKFLETLEGSGIPAFANAAQQQLRPVFDIISDLANNWDKLGEDVQRNMIEQADEMGLFAEEMAEATGALSEWTDLQKRDIMQTGAGVYRRNYLLALLKNFSQVYKVLETQENALGYSQRENARTMETYQKKVEQLRAAWQELAYTLAAEGGLLDALKGGVGSLKDMAKWFNELTPTAQKTVVALVEVGVAMTALSMLSKSLTGMTLGQGVVTLLSRETWASMRIGVQGAIAALGGLGGALTTILPVIAVLAGLTYAIVKTNREAYQLQTWFADSKESMTERIRSAEAEAKLHTQNAQLVARLTDEYRALEKQKEQGAEVAARQEAISLQVEEALGRETAARLKAANFSKEAADKVAEAERIKAKAAEDAATKQIEFYRESLREQIQTAIKSIEALETGAEGWEQFFTFFERLGLIWQTFWNDMKIGWLETRRWVARETAEFYQWMADALSKIPGVEKTGIGKAAIDSLRETASTYGQSAWEIGEKIADLRMENMSAIEASSQRVADRQRKLLTELRNELIKTGEAAKGTGKGADSGGEFGDGEKGDVSGLVEAIVSQTEALGRLNAETKANIDLLQARIAYNTREDATLEELTQADADRAKLTEQLSMRQKQLHEQAVSARSAYAQLAEMQGKINRKTEDGEKAYKEVTKAMEQMQDIAGGAAVDWWRLEQEKADLARQNNALSAITLQQLEKLRDEYDKGLLSVERYAKELDTLAGQAGLTKDAVKQLGAEQAKTTATLWNKRLEQALEDGKKALDAFGKSLDGVFDKLARGERSTEMAQALERLKNASTGLRNLADGGDVPAPSSNPYSGLSGMARQAALDAATLIGEISFDRFTPYPDALAGLDREAFIARVQEVTSQLQTAGVKIGKAIEDVGKERERALAAVEGQMKPIQDMLKGFETQKRGDEKTDLLANLTRSLAALNKEASQTATLPTAKSITDLARGVQNLFKVEDLGKLEPDQFSSAVGGNLQTLRDAARTAKGYLDTVGKTVQTELASIESQIATIDRELEAKLASLQAQLDALDREEQQDERAKAEEEHRKRLKALQDQRAWYGLNADKFANEIASLDRQIADEQTQWAEQQADWRREDERDRIQGEMDAARKSAETQKETLENKRKGKDEEQKLLAAALEAVMEYINGEIGTLQELGQARLEDLGKLKATTQEKYDYLLTTLGDVQKYVKEEIAEWQNLANERKKTEDDAWNNKENGIRKLMQDGITTTLAEMAARDPEWEARGKSMMDSLIQGVRGKQAELSGAIQAAMKLLNQAQGGPAPLPGGTSGGGGHIYAMSEGAYVKGGRGGVFSWIGERQKDEIVSPVDKLQAMIAASFRDTVRTMQARVSVPSTVAPSMDLSQLAGALERAVYKVAAAFPDTATVLVQLPDGTVQRFLAPFRQVARAQ